MSDVTTSELIVRQSVLHPNKVAIIAEDGDVTYQQLVDFACGISQFLIETKIAPEAPVAVLMHRNSNLIGTLLGIWNVGAAYVPLDPLEPAKRVLRILEQVACTRIVGDTTLWSTVLAYATESEFDVSHYTFEDVRDILPLSDATLTNISTQIPTSSRVSNLAYFLFTSGSSGEPKAVQIEHCSVTNLLLQAQDLLSVTSQDRYLASTTICFDISVVEIFLPLIIGGSLVLSDKSILLDPQGMADLVHDKEVTIVQTGPSVWSMLLNEVPNFPRLRVAISTGEALNPHIAQKLIRYAEQAWNLYGPTEATVWATAYLLTGELRTTSWSGISVPIGSAIRGYGTLIIDSDNQSVENNEKGELLISGIGLARGYHNQPKLTHERFIHIQGQRFYRTGDLVSKDNAGVLHYYGRLDDQMKIRGMRVEPREVEEAIYLDNRVKDVAATWYETPSGTKAIMAAIVLQPNITCQSTDLYQDLEGKLRQSIIPSKFIFVSSLPIDRNGKIDRTAIRMAEVTEVAQTDSQTAKVPAKQVALNCSTESIVAGIWQRMLGVEYISGDAHFFAMGGDSLAAVTMTLEVEAEVGCRLPMQLVLEVPLLRDFSKRIDDILKNKQVQGKKNFIFPLVERPGSTPLFFCGGDLSLAGKWRLPCSLYMITYWTEDGALIRKNSIEAMARYFIEGIKEKQSQGPYRIAGFSFGAIIALEISQQLTAQGDQIEYLFLLDPYKPNNVVGTTTRLDKDLPASSQKRWREYYWELLHYLNAINPLRQEHGFRGWIELILKPLNKKGIVQWFIYTLFHLLPRKHNPISEAFLARKRWPAFWFAARMKLQRYTPKPYQGRAGLLFTKGQGGHQVWSAILNDDAEIRYVESKHLLLFDSPFVDDWMQWLSDELSVNMLLDSDTTS
jgi:amino acid adenylation domain-containing protein